MKLKLEGHPIEYDLEEGAEIAKVLNAANSPLLFGCRTGICGTCLVEVIEGSEEDRTPNDDEQELLEIIAEDQKNVRLACQMKMKNDLVVRYLGKKK
jgi:ferredoxin